MEGRMVDLKIKRNFRERNYIEQIKATNLLAYILQLSVMNLLSS